MQASPLTRVFAPKTIPAVNITLPRTKGADETKPPTPNFGAFIDKFTTEKGIVFTSYIDTEEQVRTRASKVTSALSATFPGWDVVENIEDATYKPPFAVSWDFKPKKAA
jgi:hypothetical protein